MGAWEDGFAEGWRAGRVALRGEQDADRLRTRAVRRTAMKPKRKASAYSKRYGAAFKRLAKKNKKKGGGWKKGGFERTQRAAHKAARRK